MDLNFKQTNKLSSIYQLKAPIPKIEDDEDPLDQLITSITKKKTIVESTKPEESTNFDRDSEDESYFIKPINKSASRNANVLINLTDDATKNNKIAPSNSLKSVSNTQERLTTIIKLQKLTNFQALDRQNKIKFKVLNEKKETRARSMSKLSVHHQQVANYKNLKIENSFINLKGKLKLLLHQNRLLNNLTPLKNKTIIDFDEDKDISPSLKKDMSSNLFLNRSKIEMILNKCGKSELELHNDKSVNKLKDLIIDCHSYENLSPRNLDGIDFQSFLEDIRHKHFTWNVSTLAKLCNLNTKDLKK